MLFNPTLYGDWTNKWNSRFMQAAEFFSSWSKDPSTKVGAVVVNNLRQVVSSGYNGFPRGVYDDVGRYEDRSVKYPMVAHAEMNAIVGPHMLVRGCYLFVTMFPCPECTKILIQAGVTCVVSPEPIDREPWKTSARISHAMLSEACVAWVPWPPRQEAIPDV